MKREAFMAQVRAALAAGARGGPVATLPAPTPAPLVAPSVAGLDADALAHAFQERAATLGVEVRRARDERDAVAVAATWLQSANATLVADAGALAQATALASGCPRVAASVADVGVTEAFRGVAETGTLLFHGNAGRQAALLPATHLAFLHARDVRAGLTEVYAELAEARIDTGAWVQVTGPSRTADIEMTLVTGVHGPERVWVVLIDAPA